MKMLWKLTREAARYKGLYVLAIISTLALTIINLSAPKLLSSMTGIVEKGMDGSAVDIVIRLAIGLLVLKDGEIVERGTHEELLGLCGIYYDLHRTQDTEND